MINEGTILVVEDSHASLKLIMDILTAEGYQVRPADSGELALASVASAPPELILLDIRMPGMDGFEVLRRLKAREESRDIPVIVLSALTEVEQRVEGLNLGAVDFISKPFQPDELLARVRTHMELFRMRVQIKHQTADLLTANEQLHIDITERKQAEEVLRESEERFRTLIDKTPLGMCLIDIDGRYEYVNPAFVKIFGYDLSDIPTGKEWFRTAYPDPEYRKEVMADWKEDLSNYPNLEIRPRIYEVRCKGDSFRTIMFRAITLPSGKQFVIYEDISERKQVEEEKSRQKEIAERLAEEMAILADIGRLIGSTLDIEEVYGRFAVEVRKLIPFDRIAVNLHSPHEENVKVVYTFGETISGRSKGGAFPLKGSVSEVLAKTKAGLYSYRTNDQEMDQRFDNYAATVNEGLRSLMGVPLIYRNEVIGSLHFRSKTPNAYGEPNLRMAEKIGAQIAGAIANAQLFSNLRKTEESLRESEEHLNRAEKMEALGTLAGGVAHDLNNVLGIIVGYAELILDNVNASSSIKPHLVNIMNGGLKAAAIVDDLLTLARRGVSGRDVLNLNKIITDCQNSSEFEKLFSYHPSVQIKTDIEPGLPNISGSSVHLTKSLYNLVSNASEAMAKGGIVTIKTSNQYLDKLIQGYDQIRKGDYVVLSVSDTGEGIPANDLKRIFEPFYTKKVMGRSGTGLGLAVVWGTVKDHHGYINVESEEGRGSTFTLYFPVTKEDITAEAVAVTISEYMGNGESILVVDDVKEQRDLAFGMLGMLNYNVEGVSSGEEAVTYMKEHKVDLMVLDMIMDPGMDGLDTYRSVLEIHPKQKAIIVSGFSESDRVHDAQRLGAGAYVRKPYIKEKLGLAVRKELDRVA